MTYHDQATIKCHHRKLLTESDIGTDALPTVTESGKEEESDLDFLPDQRIQSLVRSCRWVLSLSARFWCHQYPSSVIWWGCADFWSRQSSVYEWWRTECFSMTAEREAVYKSTGLRTDPCGTLNEMRPCSEVWQWILRDWMWFVRYVRNNSKAMPCIPKSWWSRWRISLSAA